MKAFFDIDTQIDFLYPAGALYGKGAELLVPAIATLNRHASDNGIPLISSVCAHPENAAEFRVWPPHCVIDTLGQKKPPSTIVPNQILIPKDDLDLFSSPEIIPLLDRMQIEECYVYGVFIEYCVKCAVEGLLRTGRTVNLVRDATTYIDPNAGKETLESFAARGGSRYKEISLRDISASDTGRR
jgi:nicotinamidase/pyrazinamidase